MRKRSDLLVLWLSFGIMLVLPIAVIGAEPATNKKIPGAVRDKTKASDANKPGANTSVKNIGVPDRQTTPESNVELLPQDGPLPKQSGRLDRVDVQDIAREQVQKELKRLGLVQRDAGLDFLVTTLWVLVPLLGFTLLFYGLIAAQ
jgi:hypothetical protein